MIKKDNYFVGFIVAILSPIIAYVLFYGFDLLFLKLFGKNMVRATHYLYLLSIIPNILWIRFYLSKLKYTKSGMSVLLVTIIFVVLYFMKYYGING